MLLEVLAPTRTPALTVHLEALAMALTIETGPALILKSILGSETHLIVRHLLETHSIFDIMRKGGFDNTRVQSACACVEASFQRTLKMASARRRSKTMHAKSAAQNGLDACLCYSCFAVSNADRNERVAWERHRRRQARAQRCLIADAREAGATSLFEQQRQVIEGCAADLRANYASTQQARQFNELLRLDPSLVAGQRAAALTREGGQPLFPPLPVTDDFAGMLEAQSLELRGILRVRGDQQRVHFLAVSVGEAEPLPPPPLDVVECKSEDELEMSAPLAYEGGTLAPPPPPRMDGVHGMTLVDLPGRPGEIEVALVSGPAATQGVLAGDLLRKVNGWSIHSESCATGVECALRGAPGATTSLTVLRRSPTVNGKGFDAAQDVFSTEKFEFGLADADDVSATQPLGSELEVELFMRDLRDTLNLYLRSGLSRHRARRWWPVCCWPNEEEAVRACTDTLQAIGLRAPTQPSQPRRGCWRYPACTTLPWRRVSAPPKPR